MLALKNYSIGYGSCEVAGCEKDLAFAKAEFISILGKNGAGKSTLLKSIVDPALRLTGEITINGTNINELTNFEKAKLLSVVWTERSFSHFLKVRELLELSRAPYTSFYGKLRSNDHEIVHGVMEDFELESLANRTLGTLSDGQLQRVLIARSLAQDTPYILMDEPTSHLDINYKVDLLLKLKEIGTQRQKTIIYASHEIQLVLKLSDAIVSIHDRKIEQQSIQDFNKSSKLKEMFPSENISFNNGSMSFNF
jgi:iron complex transport system ATP-binding protein